MADRTGLLGRAAVGLAAGSAATHVVLARDAMERSPLTAGLLVVMAAACLSCAPMLIRGKDIRAWLTMLGLTGVLLFAHAQLCFDCGPELHGHTAGFLDHLFGTGGSTTLGSLALWLMLAELAVAGAGALSILTQPSSRAAVLGVAVNPNRR